MPSPSPGLPKLLIFLAQLIVSPHQTGFVVPKKVIFHTATFRVDF